MHDAASATLVADTYLGDYPQPLPSRRSRRSLAQMARGPTLPPWMLLSLNKRATASSGGGTAHNAFDEDLRTWWAAEGAAAGEWIQVDLGGEYDLRAVQVNLADANCSIVGGRPDPSDAYRYFVETRDAAGVWTVTRELDRRSSTAAGPHDYSELSRPARATAVRLTGLHQPGGAVLSVSGLRVFGLGPLGGSAPEAVAAPSVHVERDAADPRHVTVSWGPAANAEFYVVRYGVSAGGDAPVPLTHSYQVYGDTAVEIRALVTGVEYAFAVDAVNSNGVTVGTQQTAK